MKVSAWSDRKVSGKAPSITARNCLAARQSSQKETLFSRGRKNTCFFLRGMGSITSDVFKEVWKPKCSLVKQVCCLSQMCWRRTDF